MDSAHTTQKQSAPSFPQRNLSFSFARSAIGCMSLNVAGDTAQSHQVVAKSVRHPLRPYVMNGNQTIQTDSIELNWKMKSPRRPTCQLSTNVKTENSTCEHCILCRH
jgi:hypothetical protein